MGKAKGWRLDNPAEDLTTALPRHETRKAPRKALPYKAVANCLHAIRASSSGLSTRLALEFLVLMATRSGETRGAMWSEFSVEEAVWEIPARRMKGERLHRIPLSGQALDILMQARGLGEGRGFVFPGAKVDKPLSDWTLLSLVRELGFDADVHGFRTSFRTWAQERTNFPREVAEFALAHVVGDAAEQAYARSDLFEKRREMMEAWASYVTAGSGQVLKVE